MNVHVHVHVHVIAIVNGWVVTDGTARLCVATSRDLLTWHKHGPAFANAHGHAYRNAWTKSGSILASVPCVCISIFIPLWLLCLVISAVSPVVLILVLATACRITGMIVGCANVNSSSRVCVSLCRWSPKPMVAWLR